MGKFRQDKINEEVKKQLSNIIRNEVKDIRLSPLTTITDVEVTKDLSYAKAFVSVFGSNKDREKTLEALKSSSGFIRRELGKKVKLRITPKLIFELDTSVDRAMHIEELLKNSGVKE